MSLNLVVKSWREKLGKASRRSRDRVCNTCDIGREQVSSQWREVSALCGLVKLYVYENLFGAWSIGVVRVRSSNLEKKGDRMAWAQNTAIL